MLKKIKKYLHNIHEWLIREEEFLNVEEHKLLDTIREHKHEISGYYFKKLFIPHKINLYRPHITHHHVLAGLVLTIFAFKLFLGGVIIPNQITYAGGISSKALVEMTNEVRRKKHLPALTVNPKLILSARLKAGDMLEKQYWSHNAPDGTKPWKFFDQVGYFYEHAGENLATGFHSDTGVMRGWVNSRTHYENLIDPKYEEIGIAVVAGVFDGKNTTIVVQHFGKKLNSKQEIQTQPIQKQPIKQDIKKELIPPVIDDPKDNTTFNKSKILIEGSVDNNVLVHILDDELNLGLVPSDDYGKWSYITPKLYDGEHRLKAYSAEESRQSNYSNIVNINIDTIAPEIILDSLKVKYTSTQDKDKFIINIKIDNDPSVVELVANSEKYKLISKEKDLYSCEIIFDKVEGNKYYPVTIFATDDAGNSSTVDFTLEPVMKDDKSDEKLPEVLGESSEDSGETQIIVSDQKDVSLDENKSTENKLFDEKQVMKNVMEPKAEKQLSGKVTTRIKYIKIVTLIIGSLFVLAFLLQSYIVYHKGIKVERTHPIFHAVSILCIMILIIII